MLRQVLQGRDFRTRKGSVLVPKLDGNLLEGPQKQPDKEDKH